jgi:thiamine-monophosphate kinase
MALGEFDLIERYFKRPHASSDAPPGTTVRLGIGDDCALLQARPGTQLAISSDMLVEGRHFFPDVDPAHLGHKALAVNLSDLAACGAQPLAFTLALALPRADEAWLAAFSRGLFALADAHGCTLIGGDTTQGPLNICITVFGEVPVVAGKSQALLRSGARAGDDLYVSGTLGDARLALDALRGSIQLPVDVLAQARQRLEQPTPRVALGLALRGIATAAIDVSDGLLGDLQHVLKASQCGATIDTSIATQLIAACTNESWLSSQFTSQINLQNRLAWVLAGGDDYELLFTAPANARAAVIEAARISATPITRIGRIESETGLRLVDADGQTVNGQFASFDHFV